MESLLAEPALQACHRPQRPKVDIFPDKSQHATKAVGRIPSRIQLSKSPTNQEGKI